MSAPTCQSCGAPVMWRVTVDGRRIPLDPGVHPEGVVRQFGDRVQILPKAAAAIARRAGVEMWMPHHATCSSVGRHRVSRAQLAMDVGS